MVLSKLTTILIFLNALSNIAEASQAHKAGIFTPLLNDNTPCHAENLKEAYRYLCDKNFNVICLAGWKEPDDKTLIDPFNPCPIPICEYENRTCAHGECVRPNVCACDVGWDGHLCDKCVRLPNCQHGTCNNAFECNCDCDENGEPLWEGAYCQIPACKNCKNGECHEPNVCKCWDGWSGPDCTICEPLNGCCHGTCKDNMPGTCECEPGWTGHLCCEPICAECCSEETGYCELPGQCLCKKGWQGKCCDECRPYWQCPDSGKCIEPNQCICDPREDNKCCNRDIINGPEFGPWSECTQPCQFREGENPGTRTRKCRWRPGMALCRDETESCWGPTEWLCSRNIETNRDICHLRLES